MHIHERNIPQVSADCMEALREMDEWSWGGYRERLAAKGYDLYLRKDKKDIIRGYVLCKGNTKFKASELGKGRNLTASRIRQTWEKLHPEQDKQKAKQAGVTSKPTATPTPNPIPQNRSHSPLYGRAIRFTRTTQSINQTACPRNLSMTARPTNAICPTRCLTISITNLTTKNLPTVRTCRTWRWLTSPL